MPQQVPIVESRHFRAKFLEVFFGVTVKIIAANANVNYAASPKSG
jgi:hypothetical protein